MKRGIAIGLALSFLLLHLNISSVWSKTEEEHHVQFIVVNPHTLAEQEKGDSWYVVAWNAIVDFFIAVRDYIFDLFDDLIDFLDRQTRLNKKYKSESEKKEIQERKKRIETIISE